MKLPPTIAGIKLAAIKWTLIALVLFGSLWAAYQHGRHVEAGENATAQRDIAIDYAGEIIINQDKAAALADENEKLRADQAPKDRIITQEITRYVQVTPADQRCTLPGTFRVRHDAAATGQTSTTAAGGMDADPADPIEDAAVLETVGENYQTCRADQLALAAWQRRYLTIEAPR